MTSPSGSTREERLAAKLRENLRRRKEQARALGAVPARGGESPQAPGGEARSSQDGAE